MKIDPFVFGDFQTNCYVLRPEEKGSHCLIIDPGYSSEDLLDFLEEQKLTPVKILLTHGHCDHIAGISLLRRAFPHVPVCIGEADSGMLTDNVKNLSLMAGQPVELEQPDVLLRAGDLIELQEIRLKVIPTAGHTPGGISFYEAQEGVVFTGDSLFAGSVGRTDFPGGNQRQLQMEIRDNLFSLPDHIRVYPGHGPATDIRTEKNTNPFF